MDHGDISACSSRTGNGDWLLRRGEWGVVQEGHRRHRHGWARAMGSRRAQRVRGALAKLRSSALENEQ